MPKATRVVWTAADQAEQDVLVWELLDSYWQHRETCDYCIAARARAPGATPCPYLVSAIAIVLDWRRKRQLLTTAEELRLVRRAHVR